MKKDFIHFIMTGGTIDSYYDGTKDTASTREHSIIPEYIQSLRLYDNVQFTEVCMKDSRAITKDDLKKILQVIKKSTSNKIIITHGTYTMPDTARFLEENLGKHQKTIILTGSMIPLQGFSPSDAGFNLGYAIANLKNLSTGIYVSA